MKLNDAELDELIGLVHEKYDVVKETPAEYLPANYDRNLERIGYKLMCQRYEGRVVEATLIDLTRSMLGLTIEGKFDPNEIIVPIGSTGWVVGVDRFNERLPLEVVWDNLPNVHTLWVEPSWVRTGGLYGS